MLRIKPGGPNLSQEQAKILDDEFFLADPLSYFSARIAALLRSVEQEELLPQEASTFLAVTGESDAGAVLSHDRNDRDLQVAVDAVTVRHHVAEALVRLLHALMVATPRNGDAASTWVAVTDGPTSLHTVVTELDAVLAADSKKFSQAFFLATDGNADDVAAFDVAWLWVRRAKELLTDNELTVNAAHNKVKHGLAVRTRDDTRIEIVVAPDIDADGNISLSSFEPGRSIPIIDRPMVTYLARPHPSHKQGLEVTSLRVDPPVVLAEAWMMAWVYARVFHVAAARHFGAEDVEYAPYPPSRSGPTPEDVVLRSGLAAWGYRGSVTSATDPTLEPRPSGVFFPGYFQSMTIDFDSATTSTVVD